MSVTKKMWGPEGISDSAENIVQKTGAADIYISAYSLQKGQTATEVEVKVYCLASGASPLDTGPNANLIGAHTLASNAEWEGVQREFPWPGLQLDTMGDRFMAVADTANIVTILALGSEET